MAKDRSRRIADKSRKSRTRKEITRLRNNDEQRIQEAARRAVEERLRNPASYPGFQQPQPVPTEPPPSPVQAIPAPQPQNFIAPDMPTGIQNAVAVPPPAPPAPPQPAVQFGPNGQRVGPGAQGTPIESFIAKYGPQAWQEIQTILGSGASGVSNPPGRTAGQGLPTPTAQPQLAPPQVGPPMAQVPAGYALPPELDPGQQGTLPQGMGQPVIPPQDTPPGVAGPGSSAPYTPPGPAQNQEPPPMPGKRKPQQGGMGIEDDPRWVGIVQPGIENDPRWYSASQKTKNMTKAPGFLGFLSLVFKNDPEGSKAAEKRLRSRQPSGVHMGF